MRTKLDKIYRGPGEYLRKIRISKKRSIEWVATRVGISRQFYSLMELDRVNIPLARMPRISQVLECSPEKLASLISIKYMSDIQNSRKQVKRSTRKITKGPLNGRD